MFGNLIPTLTIVKKQKQHLKHSRFSVAVLVLASVSSSHAASILVSNFSFENPGGGPLTYPQPTSWNSFGSSFTQISTEIGITGATGSRHGGIDSAGETFFQDLGVSFLPSTVYTLTVAIVDYQNGNFAESSGLANFGLTDGGTLLGSTSAAGGANIFTDHTYSFTTGAVAPTGNVGILLSKTLTANGQRGLYDNIRLDATAVPEPSSAALLGGLGLLGLVGRRRR